MSRIEKKENVAPRGKTGWNAVVRFSAQFLAILLNLLATPYLVRELGVESFGIVGVVNTLVSFMAIITASLTSTVGRNVVLAVEKDDYELASKEVSTAVYGLLGLMVISAIPLFAFTVFIDKFIIIPQQYIAGTRVLFFLAVLSFGFSTVSGPLGAGMFVRNRLDLFSVVALSRTALFLCSVVILFNTFGANLVTYGVSLLSGAIFLCALHFLSHQHLLPGVSISKKLFDRTVMIKILSLGGWMTINQVGVLLFLQIDLLVSNHVLGSLSTGQLSAISVIPLQIRTLASLVSGLFAPNQTILWAQGDKSSFSKYLFRSIRYTTIFVALISGVFCGSAYEVLSIWLGPEFGHLSPIAIVLTVYLVIGLGVMPSWNAMLAVGQVKVPALVTLAMGACNVVLAIVLAGKMGLMGIALSGCIMLTLRNTLFTPWYVSRTCGVNLVGFWRELALGCLYCLIVFAFSRGVVNYISPQDMPALMLSLALTTMISVLPLVPVGMRELRQRRNQVA